MCNKLYDCFERLRIHAFANCDYIIVYKRFIDCCDNNEFEHIAIFGYDKATYQLFCINHGSRVMVFIPLVYLQILSYESSPLNVFPQN